jgi:hypothetical protein
MPIKYKEGNISMQKIKIYKTNDGKEFDSQYKARKYERQLELKPYKNKAPFNKDGQPLSYVYNENSPDIIWKDNLPFKENLAFNYFGRGRSAAHAIFTNEKGIVYQMFLKDLSELLKTKIINYGQLNGQFIFVKRGSNYGIKYLG